MTEVNQNSGERHGEFEAVLDKKKAGLMSYTRAGTDKFIVDLPEVEPGYNGKSIGK